MSIYRTTSVVIRPIIVTNPDSCIAPIGITVGRGILKRGAGSYTCKHPGFWLRLWYRIQECDHWMCSDCNRVYRYNGHTWSLVADKTFDSKQEENKI